MEFGWTEEQLDLKRRCQELATDFATRSAGHDRDSSHPAENYDILRREGFLALNIPRELGGGGHRLLTHSLAFETLAQGCPATALAFNMHASVVMPLLDSDQVKPEVKQKIVDLVVGQKKMIGGNFSEPGTTSLIGERPLTVRAVPVPGGYKVSGRKMFASMLEAADFVLVLAYPEDSTSPHAGILLLIPRGAPGRSVNANWDVLGMRATRSDSLILQDCFVPHENVMYRGDDMRRFRYENLNWFWASYTSVYLGVGGAAYDELRRVVTARQPAGYAQPLAWHPDIRRHIALLSAELDAARLITYRSAWLSDTEGATAETTAAMYRAKFVVGQAVSSITRVALTLGGAHGIYKGSRLEQLFRDGALAEIQPPPSDFCLWAMGLHELGLDPAEAMPPMRPA